MAAEIYQNQTAIPKSHIVSDPNYGDDPKHMVNICPEKSWSHTDSLFSLCNYLENFQRHLFQQS